MENKHGIFRMKIDEFKVTDFRVREIIKRTLLNEGFSIDEELDNETFNATTTILKIYTDKIE